MKIMKEVYILTNRAIKLGLVVGLVSTVSQLTSSSRSGRYIQDAPSIKSEERTLHHLGGGLSRRTSRNIIITKIIIIIERQRE